MARKNNFISSLVFLIDALSNLFKEIKKLGGDEQSFLNAFSDNEKIKKIAGIIVDSHSPFKTWRTIKLGAQKTVGELKKSILAANNCIGDWANSMLGKQAFTLSSEEKEVSLVVVSVAELGFEKHGAKMSEIFSKANELGLNLCPAEVGPQLRLQYLDQPKGEVLLIAMEPITGSGGNPSVFGVELYDVGGPWLRSRYSGPGGVWDAGCRWVFLSCK